MIDYDGKGGNLTLAVHEVKIAFDSGIHGWQLQSARPRDVSKSAFVKLRYLCHKLKVKIKFLRLSTPTNRPVVLIPVC